MVHKKGAHILRKLWLQLAKMNFKSSGGERTVKIVDGY